MQAVNVCNVSVGRMCIVQAMCGRAISKNVLACMLSSIYFPADNMFSLFSSAHVCCINILHPAACPIFRRQPMRAIFGGSGSLLSPSLSTANWPEDILNSALSAAQPRPPGSRAVSRAVERPIRRRDAESNKFVGSLCCFCRCYGN